jgi:RNA polymerase sigma factor (sigma-70 family)
MPGKLTDFEGYSTFFVQFEGYYSGNDNIYPQIVISIAGCGLMIATSLASGRCVLWILLMYSQLVKNETDATLWNRLKSGDRESFAKIYNLYINDLLSYGYRVTSHRQLIKDSIQDLFLHLWLQRENLSGTDSIKFYLFRALRNRIIRNLETRPDNASPDPEMLLENLLVDLPVEDILTENEAQETQLRRLQNAISQLPRRQQEVIQLRYHQNFSLEEIATFMQISNQSVRNLLHRSITELRKFFQTEGWILLLISLIS